MKIITKNSDETKKLGIEFAGKLKGEDVVLLYGNLGAGKTTFVQGLAQGLGISDRILSPTFVLQRIHSVSGHEFENLNHIDLYRIEELTDIDSLGLLEMFGDENAITIIEWADRLKNFEPKNGYKIHFTYLNDEEREIEIEKI